MTYPCPVCQSEKREVVRVGIREDPNHEVHECLSCHLRYIEPVVDDLEQYYATEYRQTISHVLGRTLSQQERFDHYRLLQGQRLEKFREHIPAMSTVLEVGCGVGYFLDALKHHYYPMGCDLNPDDVTYVKANLQIPANVGGVEEVSPGQHWDAIAAINLLEHVQYPVIWAKQARERLVDGGRVYIEVPNLDDALLWYSVPEYEPLFYQAPHLNYFNRETLRNCLEIAGFSVRIDGFQSYGLGNHFWWMARHEPQEGVLGRAVFAPDGLDGPLTNTFIYLDQYYRDRLVTLGMCDRLIAIGTKE